ncbi:HAMP domain-containing sensor histidine kinase [uncultured Campylobacter sp.]|uniref:sensor histidine kinase n=1 Tax=uncultured Campylobacter sp. TaxID=218934 RepID=UPI00261C5E41|nr:HAMP domain-containing sensor histidine kinase [uncultured Campylobacter sp.]
MSEAKWVIRRILFVYLTTTGIFLLIFFSLWYEKLYNELVRSKTLPLVDIHRTVVLTMVNAKYIPASELCSDISVISSVKFAISDGKNLLCSSLSFDIEDFNLSKSNRGIYKDRAFFVAPMDTSNYYINTQEDNFSYVQEKIIENGQLRTFIEGEFVGNELSMIRLKVFSSALLSFILIALISYLLIKIALKPLESRIKMLNSFIKDFTHEINTPLSVILLSIERLEQQLKDIDKVKFNRMKLAAKTLSQTYSDLVFYTFPQSMDSEDENIKLKDMIEERLEYFKLFFEQKKLTVTSELDENSHIFANRSKINKLFDNLISNAIKYNKKGGFIDIRLKDNTLSIKDSGCGMNEKDIQKIFDRYTRFNKDQGGFGIGLNLVKSICKDYNIQINCLSEPQKGSEFKLNWS